MTPVPASWKERLWRLYRNWEFRQLHRTHVSRDLVKQIEWRLRGVRSLAPDVRAAHNLSLKLKDMIS